jgi:predicted secreted hydrolase
MNTAGSGACSGGWCRFVGLLLVPVCILLFVLVPALPLSAAEGAAQAVADTDADADYPPVRAGELLQFPRDHGAHPAHRTEWWYITGWLRDEAGVERGVQLTFFRVRTRIGEDNPSRFAPRQLILAHAAIADPARGRLLHAERAARAYPGLVGAAEGRTAIELDDWFLRAEAPTAGKAALYRSRIVAQDFAYELDFVATRSPLLQGEAGFSQKAPAEDNASHYYSRPQLQVSGVLQLGSERLQVEGTAWLDHEWSSAILPEQAQGWDWLGINLTDGGALMLFQMRGHDGQAIWASGTELDAQGRQRHFGADAIRFRPLRYWQSPRTAARYPVVWQIELDDGRRFVVRPLFDDQELDSRASTGAVYWEGAVVLDQLQDGEEGESSTSSRPVGRGYLEMTGYLARLRM